MQTLVHVHDRGKVVGGREGGTKSGKRERDGVGTRKRRIALWDKRKRYKTTPRRMINGSQILTKKTTG